MMRFRRVVRFLVLASVMMSTFGVSCATAQVAVQTSHVGSVTAIAYHPETGSIVSGGSDGRIKVWSIEQERIIRSVQAGTAPITAMAVHPEDPEVAVVSAEGAEGYRLQVWDLSDGTRRFTDTLEAAPLVLGYAPSGDFIVVAESRNAGMRYFGARNGRELDYPEVPQGIVTYATVARSERTMMTYVAADGSIRYWSLSGGEVIGEAATLAGLDRMQVLENKRYAAALHEGDLVVVDIVDGSLKDRVPVGRVTYLTVAPGSGEIVLLETRAAGRRVTVYEFDGEFLIRDRVHENPVLEQMSVVTLAGTRLYGGTDAGELYAFSSRDGREEQLVRNVVVGIHDIALVEDTLYVNAGERTHRITTDFFTEARGRLDRVEQVETAELESFTEAPLRLLSLSDGTLVAWGTEGPEASTLYVLEEEGFREVFSTEADIHAVREYAGSVLVLTRGDSLFRLALPDFSEELRYSALGMETAVGTENFGIVIGKSRTNAFDAAVLTIDPVTRETVGLESDAFLVFDLAYDPENGELYALGVTREEEPQTVITRFSGSRDLSERTRVFRLRGEYLDGNLAFHPESGSLYTSIGRSGITRVTGRRTETYGSAVHASRHLETSGGFLWSVNRDGSVSLWEPDSGERIGDVYVFEDGGWALLTTAGRFYASSDQAEEFVAAVNEDDETESLRLTLPE